MDRFRTRRLRAAITPSASFERSGQRSLAHHACYPSADSLVGDPGAARLTSRGRFADYGASCNRCVILYIGASLPSRSDLMCSMALLGEQSPHASALGGVAIECGSTM